MGYKGLKVLEALEENFTADFISEVICSRDINIEHDYFDEIKLFCSQKKIVFKHKSEFTKCKTPFSFSIAWRWLIPLNENKLIIFHDSLLPRYRGFAPVVNALINKEKKIGVTALYASSSFDEGRIIEQSSIQITYPLKINDVIKKITLNYIELVLKISQKISTGKNLPSIVQDESKATYSIWRDEDDYLINWNDSAHDIQRFIDAVGYPYRGAKSFIEGECVRILDSEVYKDINLEIRHPGKILLIKNDFPVVICGSGMLMIKNIVSEKNKNNLLPLTKFRTRFQNFTK